MTQAQQATFKESRATLLMDPMSTKPSQENQPGGVLGSKIPASDHSLAGQESQQILEPP